MEQGAAGKELFLTVPHCMPKVKNTLSGEVTTATLTNRKPLKGVSPTVPIPTFYAKVNQLECILTRTETYP